MRINSECHTVGIIGTDKGTGVTHLGLMITVYLTMVCGKRTAMVVPSGSANFRQAWGIASNSRLKKIISKIHIITVDDYEELSRLISEGYEYLVVDFGCDYEKHRIQFGMCRAKLAVGSLSWWKIQNYVGFLVRNKGERGMEKWKFLSPTPVETGMRYLKHNFKVSVREIPYEPDPLSLGPESLNFLRGLSDDF